MTPNLVRVTCRACRCDVVVPPQVVAVLDFAGVISYSCPCPACGRLIMRDCCEQVAMRLVGSGALYTDDTGINFNTHQHPAAGGEPT